MTKAKANVSAKAKTRVATANKARVARDGQTRRAALGALAANDTSAKDYTKPKPKAAPKAETAPQSSPAPRTTAPSARGSKVASSSSSRDTSQQRPSRSNSDTSASTSTSTSTRTRTSAPAAPRSSSSGWVRPLASGQYSSGYGYRWGRMHSGVDFATPVGTPLRAMNSGTVTEVGTYGGQGNRVVVRFDNGTEAHYAHMSSFAVSSGQRVSAGQTIGASGNSGNSTGPHLHLEIHVGGSPINPSGWLSARGLI